MVRAFPRAWHDVSSTTAYFSMSPIMNTPSQPGPGPQIDADAVRQELARILASRGFRESSQLADFLRFVVAETLAGREDRLKQYTIAVHALARAHGFNPKHDPIVRVTAHRVRRLLKEYYDQNGASVGMRIEIRAGHYTPEFHTAAGECPRSATVGDRAEPSSPGTLEVAKPLPSQADLSLLILAFAGCGRDAATLACSLAEQLALRLTPNPAYRVLGPWPRPGSAGVGEFLSTLGNQFGVRFVLDGSVCTCSGDLRVAARLFDARTARNVWAETYRYRRRTFGTTDEVASLIAAAVADDWGAIPLAIERETRNRSPVELTSYELLLRRNRWIREFSAESLADTIRCLEHAVRTFPDHSSHRAWLAWAYLDDFAHGMGLVENHFVRVADVLAGTPRRDPAAEAEVRCMGGYANFLQGNRSASLREHEAAWRANPDDPSTNIVFASDACALGDWDRGLTLVRAVMERTPQYPDWLHLLPAVGHYLRGEYEECLSEAQRCQTDTFPWSPLCRAAALGQLGRREKAAAEMRRLLDLVPDFRTRGTDLMRRILYSHRSVKAMSAGLQKATEALA